MASHYSAPRPASPINRVIDLPGSKSLMNRALVLAAIADLPSVIHRPLRSRDTTLMAGALTALGTDVDTTADDAWRIEPAEWTTDGVVDCGLAGTVMRFIPPVAGLSTGVITFDGDPHMRSRPVGPMLTALSSLGLHIEDDGRGALPFSVHGTGHVAGGAVDIDASSSSQFVSALLIAGARFRDGLDLRHVGAPVPSTPHIEMTIDMLRTHGIEVDDSEADRWRVAPGRVKTVDHVIEPDLSNAAPFLGLAAATGGSITIRDWPTHTTQPGDALRDILTRMGADVRLGPEGLTVTGTGGLRGVDLDLHEVGELTPAIAGLCALADSPSTLSGVAHIRGHETDRITALARELSALGADVSEHPDGLTIVPSRLTGGVFHTYADHRMAHAAVLVGSVVEGVLVEDIDTTSKTFPDFASTWEDVVAGDQA